MIYLWECCLLKFISANNTIHTFPHISCQSRIGLSLGHCIFKIRSFSILYYHLKFILKSAIEFSIPLTTRPYSNSFGTILLFSSNTTIKPGSRPLSFPGRDLMQWSKCVKLIHQQGMKHLPLIINIIKGRYHMPRSMAQGIS